MAILWRITRLLIRLYERILEDYSYVRLKVRTAERLWTDGGPRRTARRWVVVSLEVITADAYLDVDPNDFKLNLLLHGADAWKTNSRYVEKMGWLASIGAVLFSLQVAVLAVWVLHG
jgi:hypothetical protein